MAAKASKVLTSTTTTPDERSVAASALAQAEPDDSAEVEQLRAELARVNALLLEAHKEADKLREASAVPDAEHHFLYGENSRLAAEVARLGDELAKQRAWQAGAGRR